MLKDYSKITSFWRSTLQILPEEIIDGVGLSDATAYFLTHIGLPNDLDILGHALEINFYFQRDQLEKKEFNGINYFILGDDSGSYFGISLRDDHLYAIDLNTATGADPICFVNSGVDKFVETIQLFAEYQQRSNVSDTGTLIDSMRVGMSAIDEMSLADENTWWSTILNDPISGQL